MLTENQQKWVAALRSGEFKQSVGRLHDPIVDGYCCLGVACVAAEREGVTLLRGKLATVIGGDLNSQPAVKSWLGMKSPAGSISSAPTGNTSLIRLNDSNGLDFSQLADIIEAHAEELFHAE